jgi:hypothetical protein
MIEHYHCNNNDKMSIVTPWDRMKYNNNIIIIIIEGW